MISNLTSFLLVRQIMSRRHDPWPRPQQSRDLEVRRRTKLKFQTNILSSERNTLRFLSLGMVQELKLFLLNVDYRKRIFSILHYGENNELWTESLSVVKINSYINNLLVIKFCSVNSLEVLPSSFMYSHLNSQLVVSCSLSHWDINTKIISETALFATYLHHGTEPRIFSCSRRSSTALTAERKMREECVRPAISEMMEI